VHRDAARAGTTAPWSGIELRQFAALQAVAREGSIDGAARALGLTHGAVSEQVAALERMVGDRLVERLPADDDGARLTSVGRVALYHAEAMLAQAHVAAADVASRRARTSQAVRLAIAEDAAPFLLPRLLARLGDRREIALEVREVGGTEAGAWLQDGRADVAIAPTPPEPGDFVVRELLDDPYVLVLRADAEEPDELGDSAFVESATPDAAYCAALVETGLEGRRVVARCDRLALVLQLVAAGLGVALLPRACVGDDSPLRTVPVPEAPSRTLSAFWLRARLLSPTALWFVGTVEAAGRELREAAA
jgi:LysR family transcriptional regulator, hydrogen peroxide-inducible genes activator